MSTRGSGRHLSRIGWNAGLGLAAAVGLLVGIRAIAVWTVGGPRSLLRITPLPLHDLGVSWSDTAVFPQRLQVDALEGLVGTVAALALACATLGVLNAIIVLSDAAATRRGADAVRLAVGADAWRLTRETLGRVRTLGLAAATVGLLGGLVAGVALRAAWPGALGGLTDSGAGWDLLLALGVASTLVGAAALSGVASLRRPGRAAGLLRQGRQVGDAPGAVFVRSSLSVAHIGVGASCLLVALVLLGWPAFDTDGAGTDGVWLLESEVGGSELAGLLEEGETEAGATGAVPGSALAPSFAPAWSDSSSGALLGLGIRDVVVTQCGNCIRSLMPAPLWTLRASNFAVGADWFELAGVEIVEGRTFEAGAGPDDELEVVVDVTVARSAFENGDAIGRRLRIGRDHARWYTVVGVVESHTPDVLGADGSRPAVYLDSRQVASGPSEVIVRGGEAEATRLADRLRAAGALTMGPRPLPAYMDLHVRPYRWLGALAAALGALALLLAAHGSWVASVQSARRRRAEFALRRAIGASPRSILTLAARERVRLIGIGLFVFSLLGTAAVAGIGVSVSETGLRPFLQAGAWLGVVSFGATLRAAWLATRVAPAHALD